jgi:predicted GH43/DUF377 family glycosyl hydrolase
MDGATGQGDAMGGLQLKRLGVVMTPEPGNPNEVEGVLNPGAARGPDGSLYLFPRLVAKGNYSRIGIARVRFNDGGDPKGVERLGIALQPEADYELRPGGGGCEDPRVTFVEPLKRYIMTYTAFSPLGPRIAMAESEDLFHWNRLGLASYAHWHGIELGDVDDKDASLFPIAIPDSTGKLELGMLHRPLFAGTCPKETALQPGTREVDLDRESIWISYCPAALKSLAPDCLGQFTSHHRLATPVSAWERLKIGAGTPPILTKHGWLIVYHGVSEVPGRVGDHLLCYSAVVMVLSKQHPRLILYRSTHPVLTPMLPGERDGTVANVVFPTGIDRRDDLGAPDCLDVYYGMADNRIGVARLDLPEQILAGAVADAPEATV